MLRSLPPLDPWAKALAVVLAATLAGTFWALGALGWSSLLTLLFTLAIFPGIALAKRIYGDDAGATGSACLVGPVWGFAATSIALLLLWVTGLHHPVILILAPAIAGVAVFFAARPMQGMLTPMPIGTGDLKWVLLVLLLVPAVVSRPYSQVGVEVGDGRAYRAYFTADFVWKMAVVAEVAKGDVPPVNPFMAGAPLNYYWLPHLFSAAEYRALAPYLRLESHLLVNATLFGLAFIVFLYALARQCGASPPWAAAGVAIAVLGGSFEGTERLLFIWERGAPLDFLRTLNIDAVSRWFYGALPTDGLHRLLLYQPQHHAMAYATGLSAILAIWQAKRLDSNAVWAFAGCCIGTALLLSAFSALMLTCMTIPVAAVALIHRGHVRASLRCAMVAAVPGLLAGAAVLALGYVQPGDRLIELGLNDMAVSRLWPAFVLNFGVTLPLVIAALIGLAAARQPAAWMLGLPVLIAFGFYFLVDVRDMQGVYVGWRVAHLVFMLTAPLAAWVLQRAWQTGRARRALAFAVIGVGVLLALPTVAIDLYNTQDITNRRPAAGFPWTLVLSPDEQAALNWIRTETPSWAVVQVDPVCRGAATWSYIPSFAQRRMAAGLPISMIPLAPYQSASGRVHNIFVAGTAAEAYDAALRNSVDYVMLGPPELKEYPQLASTLDGSPDLFPLMFQVGQVRVYQVGPVARRAPKRRAWGWLSRKKRGA